MIIKKQAVRKTGAGPIIHYGPYVTRYTVEVEEVIRTNDAIGTPSSLQFDAGGAIVAGEEIADADVPLYRVGERYLLFLTPVARHTSDAAEEAQLLTPVSSVYSSFLLRDGQVHGPLGPGGTWLSHEEKDEAALLQYLRDEVAALPAAGE